MLRPHLSHKQTAQLRCSHSSRDGQVESDKQRMVRIRSDWSNPVKAATVAMSYRERNQYHRRHKAGTRTVHLYKEARRTYPYVVAKWKWEEHFNTGRASFCCLHTVRMRIIKGFVQYDAEKGTFEPERADTSSLVEKESELNAARQHTFDFTQHRAEARQWPNPTEYQDSFLNVLDSAPQILLYLVGQGVLRNGPGSVADSLYVDR